MTGLRHRRYLRAVDALVDDELDEETTSSMLAHVRECWQCSVAAETTQLIKRSLRRMGGKEPTLLAAGRLRRLGDRPLAS